MSSNKNWGDGHIDWVASYQVYEEFVAGQEAGHQVVAPKGENKAKKAEKRAAQPGAGEPVKKKQKKEEKKVEENQVPKRRHSV